MMMRYSLLDLSTSVLALLSHLLSTRISLVTLNYYTYLNFMSSSTTHIVYIRMRIHTTHYNLSSYLHLVVRGMEA